MTLGIDLLAVSPGQRLPEVANVIVEIPKGRRSKFEVDKVTGLMKLDRYLYSSSHYPGDYGFIPQTLAEDDDALDALVMVSEPTFPSCLIETRVVGLFRMQDRGRDDAKILGVPDSDPLFANYRDLGDVPPHFLKEVEHFFLTYKQLEGADIRSHGWADSTVARAAITACVSRWRSLQGSATRP